LTPKNALAFFEHIYIPTIIIAWPVMIILLIPNIFLKALIGMNLDLSQKEAFRVSVRANLFTTFLGFPLTNLIFDVADYNLKNSYKYILGADYASFLVLLALAFCVAVWMERLVAVKTLKAKVDLEEMATRWSISANLATYGLLVILVSGYAIYDLAPVYFPSLFTAPIPRNVAVENEIMKIVPLADSEDATGFSRNSLAVSREFAVFGSDGDNSGQGAVFIYQKDRGGNNNWVLFKKITASDGEQDDCFGQSVFMSRDLLAVGAVRLYGIWGPEIKGSIKGSVYIFEKNRGGANNWGEVKKIVASDGVPGDHFGVSVAISGDTLVVGRKKSIRGPSGAVFIFKRNHGGTNNWGQVKKITPDSLFNDDYGFSVSISGDTLVVRATNHITDIESSCLAYIYQRDKGGVENWGEVKTVSSSPGKWSMCNESTVAINGDTLVMGTPDDANRDGSVFVFKRNYGGKDNWGLVQNIMHYDKRTYQEFGHSVSIKKDVILVGNVKGDGFVYVYKENSDDGGSWKLQKKLTPSDPGVHYSKRSFEEYPFTSLSSDTAIIRWGFGVYLYNINN
jgi:hypothetical protein